MLPQWVMPDQSGPQLLDLCLSVTLRGGRVFMSGHDLYHPQVLTFLQPGGNDALPDGGRGQQSAREAALQGAHQVVDTLALFRGAQLGQDQGLRVGAADLRPALGDVALEHQHLGGFQRQPAAVRAGRGRYLNNPFRQPDVLDAQGGHFRDRQPLVDQQPQDDFITGLQGGR